MKQSIFLCLLLTYFTAVVAQKEVLFNDTNVDKSEIKVAKTISGIEFDLDFIRILPGRYTVDAAGSVETHLSYFHENRIANTWTLNKSIGLGNAFYRNSKYIRTSEFEVINTGSKTYNYVLSLDLKIEPRWYFDQILRYRNNKSTHNNSGWFLSLPLIFSTNILQQPIAGFTTGWIPKEFVISVIAPPTLGYRNSFADNWFVEVSLGYIPYRAVFYNGITMKSAKKIGAFSADSFNSELKIAFAL